MGWKFLLPISDAGRTHFGCVSRITQSYATGGWAWQRKCVKSVGIIPQLCLTGNVWAGSSTASVHPATSCGWLAT